MSESTGALFLVEDSFDDEVLSLKAISDSGVRCKVEVSRHGGEALARLIRNEGQKPDLIVLDFDLPGLNGLEILRGLRKEPATRHIPVVILSDQGSSEEISLCLAEGASSCVQKPLDPKAYIERVALIVRYWLTVDSAR